MLAQSKRGSAAVWKEIAAHVRAGLAAKLKLLQRRVLEHKQCSMMWVTWNRIAPRKELETITELVTCPSSGPARRSDVLGMTQIQNDDLKQRISDYYAASE